MYDHIKTLSSTPLASIPTLSFSLTIQPVPPAITSKDGPAGGNSLGLDSSDGALVLALISATWDDPDDDALVEVKAQESLRHFIDEAKERKLWNEWLYLNYANQSQDPIAGYGADVQQRFREVSGKYDPEGVFQKLVPGGFKLS